MPFLPQKAIDPFGVLIPFNIWLIVITMSSIGFVGYFFEKYFSTRKSVFLTSIFGSLVSSTLVTTTLAAKSKKESKNINLLITSAMLAIAVMQARVIFEIIIFAQEYY